jgi:periplasmic protein TonB
VTLRVLVGVDGRVVRAEQVTATSEEFWRVTLQHALARWRFKPATRDGIPYEAWRTMTVRFTLQGG